MENASVPAVDTVRESYSARSQEYADLFGSAASAHPLDRALIGSWADTVSGPVLDAGCGPGQWTDFMAGRGLAVSGVDLVPEFVERAREHYPDLSFGVGTLDALDIAAESLGGVLSWFSLIHHCPRDIRTPLAEFARVIRPGGGLLVGFFTGPTLEAFEHAVTTAYRWPAAELGHELDRAGFRTVETHTRTRNDHRPLAAITAIRKTAG